MDARDHQVTRIHVSRATGWLLPCLEATTDGWVLYCHIGSWTGVFHDCRPDPDLPSGAEAEDSILTVQNNIIQDTCWLIATILSVVGFLLLKSKYALTLDPALFSVASYRAFDFFVQGIRLSIFGIKNPPFRTEDMSIHRIQRRIFLTLLHLIELIFLYAILFWTLRGPCGTHFKDPLTEPVHALLVSFSTLSTIGYGTYAPNNTVSTVLTMLESFTALLWISGILAQMIGKSVTEPPSQEEYKKGSMGEWRRRRWLPPTTSLSIILSILFVYYLVYYHSSSNGDLSMVIASIGWLCLIISVITVPIIIFIQGLKLGTSTKDLSK